MLIVSICQEMKWDYFQYLNQPEWFLELIRCKMVIDAENAKELSKQYANRNRR